MNHWMSEKVITIDKGIESNIVKMMFTVSEGVIIFDDI